MNYKVDIDLPSNTNDDNRGEAMVVDRVTLLALFYT